MDPLSALAIAAAAFQFLELGAKLCVKGWEKYKQIQRERIAQKLAGKEELGKPKLAEEEEELRKTKLAEEEEEEEPEEELRKTLEELSDQISWFREFYKNISLSEAPTMTQAHLLKLSSRCVRLSDDFERIKSRMALPNHQTTEPAMRRHQENDETYKNEQDIERVARELGPLKRELMDSIILSLWYVRPVVIHL